MVLDETLIPSRMKYIPVRNCAEAVQVIRDMKTRAFGQLLVVLSTFLLEIRNDLSQNDLVEKIQAAAESLNASRPTFPFAEVTGMVVFWAVEAQKAGQDIRVVLERNINGYLSGIRGRRMERAARIAEIIKDGDSILTHCNVSGELAMAAVLCQQQRKRVQFFAAETRPYMQGARLTAWELKRVKAKVILVADNAAGSLMADGLVNKVIVGSDRNCANGDFANKIGTYQLAVLAKEFSVPFYVLTQPSSRVKRGEDIPIEIRDEKELLNFAGRKIFKGKVKGFYPGFDVVPAELVTGGAIPIKVTRD